MPDNRKVTEQKPRLSPAKMALFEQRLRGEALSNAAYSLIPRRLQKNFLPLSFAQQRLWFLDQLNPASSAYNMSVAFRLSGPLDRVALTAAINAVIARHEILRTTFTVVSGIPVQVINATLICDPLF